MRIWRLKQFEADMDAELRMHIAFYVEISFSPVSAKKRLHGEPISNLDLWKQVRINAGGLGASSHWTSFAPTCA